MDDKKASVESNDAHLDSAVSDHHEDLKGELNLEAKIFSMFWLSYDEPYL